MKDGVQSSRKPFWLRMNKQLYVIIICFSISTIFWLLLALSHDFPTTITFPVRYVHLPGKKVIINDLPTTMEVQLRTSGFKILSFGFNRVQDTIEVDVAEKLLNAPVGSDVLALPTGYFLNDFSTKLGKEVQIQGFKPDSIVFNFSDLITKKVAVILNYKATFEKQYDTVGPPSVNPSFVEVSGPPSVIEKLKSVNTEPVYLENLKSIVKQKVKLEESKLLTYNVNEVEMTLPIEKFTEGSVEIEIKPINVNQGYTLKTFPDKVKVRYLVAISRYNKSDPSMFDAVVDGGDIQSKHLSKLDVQVITSPNFVRITLLEPDKVDYILRRQ